MEQEKERIGAAKRAAKVEMVYVGYRETAENRERGERQGRIQTPGIFGRAISNNNSHEALPYHDCRKP